jgi:hypothetical protein
MAMTPDANKTKAVARQALACLRSLDKKLDIAIDAALRNEECLIRIERSVQEFRRDLGRD